MLRPISPFVEYAINYDYISKVLCINKDKPTLQCNGKCQLMQKLEIQQKEDYNSLRISMEEYPIGFVKVLSLKTQKSRIFKKENNFSLHSNYSFLFSNSVFHPPTV